MRARALFLLVFAVVAAGGTAYLARGWLNAQRAQVVTPVEQPKEVASVYVLVAAQTLPTGTFVRDQDLRWQAWPDEDIPENYLIKETTDKDELVGAVVRARIVTGEPILPDQVVKPGDKGFLAAVIRPGMRALTVHVDRASGGAGLVFPGDQVDLILTHGIEVEYETQEDGKQKTKSVEHQASETVARGVRVVAVDQYTDVQDGDSVVAKTATLEVTPKQAEVVAVSAELGTLTMSLKSLVDTPESLGGQEELILVGTQPESGPAPEQRSMSLPEPQPSEPSYTWDSDASNLITPPGTVGGNRHQTPITVARGSESESVNVDRVSK